MVDFLVRHKLLNSYQHGFLKARSRLTNMLRFYKEIIKWIDEGSPVDIIYSDFRKAFDKVTHQRLLLKLIFFNKIAIPNNKFQMASVQGSHWLIESPKIKSPWYQGWYN